MKKLFLFFFPLILLGAGCSSANIPPNQTPSTTPNSVFCTEEAKLCPDGSYVSRTGPHCEFSPCPRVKIIKPKPVVPPAQTSGIEGSTTLGPTCPVERIPPDPNCAPRPYQATITVESASDQQQITQFTTGVDGTFKINLSPGNYLLVPVSPSVYPRGITQTVTVEQNKFTPVTISFDSGIR